MSEKNEATSPKSPATFTNRPKAGCPARSRTSTSGAVDCPMKSAPVLPAARKRTAMPVSTRMAIAPMMARGTSLRGSRASSDPSGTPSMPRKNQMPNGSAAKTPATP